MTNTKFSPEIELSDEFDAIDAIDSLETITAVARSIAHDDYRVLMGSDDGIGVPVDTMAALQAAENAIERVFYLVGRDIERASA
jgi:hypothetical protein